MAHKSGDQASPKLHMPEEIDCPAISGNRHHHSQQLARANWRVGRRDGIALGHETIAAPGDHAVGEQAIITREHRDLAASNLGHRVSSDHKCVAGPDGRKHARTGHPQAGLAAAIEEVDYQLRSYM